MCGRITTATRSIELYKTEHAFLAQSFSVNPEKCENPDHFNEFIRIVASGDYRKGTATTHIMIERDEHNKPVKICGYIALKATSLITDDNKIYGDPAIEIAELAVDETCEGSGVGKALLQFAASVCDQLRDTIGIRYLLVCAEKHAVSFYKRILPFVDVKDYYRVPREMWNDDCIPLLLMLPEKTNEPSFIGLDEEY